MDVDQGGTTSIAARIAALKLDHVGRQHAASPPVQRARPQPPPPPPPPPLVQDSSSSSSGINSSSSASRPPIPPRQQSVNVPPLNTHTPAVSNSIGNQPADGRKADSTRSTINGSTISTPAILPQRGTAPALPPRRPSGLPPPQLPPRRPSDAPSDMAVRPPGAGREIYRKPSTQSMTSIRSASSTISKQSNTTGTSTATASSAPMFAVKAPHFDAAKLPPLPLKREKSTHEMNRVPLKSSQSTTTIEYSTTKLPQKSPMIVETVRVDRPYRSPLTMGFSSVTQKPTRAEPTPAIAAAAKSTPPPVPLSSRPNLAQLQASKPKPVSAPAPAPAPAAQPSCLKCRDFSAVDAHAAKFPRGSLPSTDLTWLAQQLTAPFPSLTDKARAIFTWLHHNISYDTAAFFSGNVRPSTPASTLATGLAVCEGYAGLFTALAAKSGLESVVVGGHGKGYGYAALGPNAPLPPYNPSGHAWNAVKLDDGAWKLIDCCWGAGVVNGPGQPYKKLFSPHHFTRDNDDFGLSHFPADKSRFYRTDGRAAVSWEEYLLGPNNGVEGPQMFGGYTAEEGIAVESFLPASKRLSVSNASAPYVRFQFSKVCAHWDNERHGLGKHYCYVVEVGGVDGKAARRIPFESNDMFWWADVAPRELGAPGAQVKIMAVTSFEGRDGRGVTAREYREKDGRVSQGFGFVALYELVR